MNTTCNIKKLDKDRFVELSTGEIREFEHSTNRQDNYNSLRQTFKKLRYLINNNFIGSANEKHITLTYKENMMDTKRLYSDFDKFMKRLRYEFKDKSTIDYISVVEPQERGAWHCHVLVRFNDVSKIFVSNNKIRELWTHGKIVSTKSLTDVDNIGAYLSAYLTDIELKEGLDSKTILNAVEEKREIVTKNVEGTEKKFIKGGRLHMYPPGMNLFRKSKGMIYPERIDTTYKKAKKIVGSAQPHFKKSYNLEDIEKDYTNTLIYEQYNTKRTK